MIILALDYGEKRIGVALSSADEKFVFSRPFIKRVANTQAIDRVIELINQEKAELIVLGAPYNMDDSLGESMEKVLIFKKSLEKKINYTTRLTDRPPVVLWDERNTTTEATRILLEQDVSRKKRKDVIDSLAASLLLEDYLKQKGV